MVNATNLRVTLVRAAQLFHRGMRCRLHKGAARRSRSGTSEQRGYSSKPHRAELLIAWALRASLAAPLRRLTIGNACRARYLLPCSAPCLPTLPRPALDARVTSCAASSPPSLRSEILHTLDASVVPVLSCKPGRPPGPPGSFDLRRQLYVIARSETGVPSSTARRQVPRRALHILQKKSTCSNSTERPCPICCAE